MQTKTCKTCKHWRRPSLEDKNMSAQSMTNPLDYETDKPMARGFETRICKHPQQTFAEPPVTKNGFGLTDASMYFAVLATAEDFGCVLHEQA